MNTADQPSKGDSLHDVLDRVIGMIWRRRVIDGEENSRHALQNEKEQTRRAESVPPVALWFRTVEQIFVQVVQTKAFVKPVENFFPHRLGFLVEYLEHAIFAYPEFAISV